ncbi:MAG: hypothetical protein QF569_23770 [Candidatus Poribacteria bacterium]|nr:hypothetical protein [Candidatus Poribacteria bacterium]
MHMRLTLLTVAANAPARSQAINSRLKLVVSPSFIYTFFLHQIDLFLIFAKYYLYYLPGNIMWWAAVNQ